MTRRIVVTGMGIWCPLGSTPEEVLRRLERRESGIGPLTSLDASSLRVAHAAEIHDFDPRAFFTRAEIHHFDRATQFALVVAGRALERSGLPDGNHRPERMGVCVGTSGAGQFQTMQFSPSGEPIRNRKAALYHSRTVPHFQAQVLAERYHLQGPQAAYGCASVGSVLAIIQACHWLRSGRVDAMLAGGAEMLTGASLAAMTSLGLSAPQPCAPFTGSPGITFGEGAAFMVLESLEGAEARGAEILGEVLGYGVSADAYDGFSNDPAGQGLRRAMEAALRDARLERGQVGWIRASGTGHREQDRAETRVIRSVFGDAAPPVSSLESALGHANGVAPVIGLVSALQCARARRIPPTLNAGAGRPGCDLDYVVDGPRPSERPQFLSNAIAFGGLNAVVAASGTPLLQHTRPGGRTEEIVITGLGLVSPVGSSPDTFAQALRQGRGGIRDIDRFTPAGRARRAGLVDAVPGTAGRPGTRRQDRLRQYAAAAVASALREATSGTRALADERLGLLVALSRSPVAAHERFLWELPKMARFTASAGRSVLEMGGFSVLSQLSATFKAKGYGAVMSEGIGGGLHALVHGMELLRQDDSQDALVVVAADELSPLFQRLHDQLGVLSTESRGGESLRPYDPHANGMVLGEGAVAFVLERRSSALSRRARIRAHLSGSGLTSDARGYLRLEPEGRMLEHAMRAALSDAGLGVHDLDLLYGHGRGLPLYDSRELLAFQRLLDGHSAPLCCVMGHTGVAESSCGLFSVAAALLGLEHGEAWPLLSSAPPAPLLSSTLRGSYRHALVAGSTDSGANAALILSRHESDQHTPSS